MKRAVVLAVCVAALAAAVSAQGFTGPGAAGAGVRAQAVTVAQAKGLPKNSLVILTGSIVQALKGERYTFRDATGDITVEIDNDLWVLLDVSVEATDTVEIGGKTDVEKRVVEIDVKYLKKR